MSLFNELKRRNVFRVGIAYVVVAWLTAQVVDLVLENFGAPAWFMRSLLVVLAAGLPLALVFAWAFEMTPEGLKKEKDVDRSQSVTQVTGRKLDRMIIGIMAVVIAFLVLDRFVLEDESSNTVPATETQTAAIEETVGPMVETGPSVAVLPFINMSGDADNEYFSDGLTETLLHMLAQLPELRVAARTSSFAFKGTNTSIEEISKTLSVAHVLEGSVQKAGNRVRITAQLIRADDGFHVWSQNYDRTLEDIFAIQDEIATDVANALDTSLLGGGNEIHNVDTTNLSAYEAYLKAREQQAITSFSSLPDAQRLLKEALATDPGFNDAKLALASNYRLMSWTGIISEDEARRHSMPLIEQVLTSDPGNYLARALKLQNELGFSDQFIPEERARVFQELRDLLPLLPDSTFLRDRVATYLGFVQVREQEAIEVLEAGLLIDPLSAILHDALGKALRRMDRYEESMASFQRALAQQPDNPNFYFNIADLKADLGDLNGALEWRRKGVEVDPQDHELTAELAQDLYDLGLLEEGNYWADRSIALAPQSAVGRRVRLQQAYASGDMEQALLLARSMIKDQVSIRQGSLGTALDIHNELMSANGHQQEAYDFLLSVRPELEDFATFPGDWKGMFMQRRMILLMLSFKSPEEIQQAWLGFTNNLDRSFPRWRKSTENQVLNELVQGRFDEAERLAIDVHLSRPVADDLRRVEDLQGAEFGAINQRPELMARMSEVQLEKARLRDGVSEMMQQPEWQQ